MVNDEFVDLDEIVPGTGFRKRPDEMPPKKEVKQEVKPKVQESAPEPSEKPEKPIELKSPKSEKQGAQKIIDATSSEEIEEETVNFQEQSKAEIKSSPVEKKAKEEKKKEEKKEEIKSRPAKEEIKKSPTVLKVYKSEPKLSEKKQPEKIAIKKPVVVEVKKSKSSKKTEKKIIKKGVSKKTEGKETNWVLIALLILGAIIIGIVVYMALKFDFSDSNQESVVAVVNGQPIYKSELANRYNLLVNTMSPSIDEAQVLNLTITDKLLLQEAEKRGIKTSDKEVEALLNEIMIQNNIDEISLKADLELKNISYDFLFNLYRSTLTINKLINESFSNLSLSDEELEEFYEANKDSLKLPDMVQVRHILFMYGEDSENDTYIKADKVAKLVLSDKSNFCNLVLAHTQDTGSAEICGEYNFSIDYPFVPEFIDAGFSMSPGEVKIIKTQIGYHIMYKVANLPGYVPELNDIKDKLSPVLIEDKTIKELQTMIADLQANAIIEIYNETISTKRFKEVSVNNKLPVVKEETTTEEIQVEAQEKEGQEIVQEVVEETIEVPVESSQEVVVIKEIVSTPSSQKFILATCLADKGDRMFTASWSPDSQAQLDLFGEYASNLEIVECDPESSVANLEECSKVLIKQYPTWPTWQINGTLYEGIQSLAALSKYSGCSY